MQPDYPIFTVVFFGGSGIDISHNENRTRRLSSCPRSYEGINWAVDENYITSFASAAEQEEEIGARTKRD